MYSKVPVITSPTIITSVTISLETPESKALNSPNIKFPSVDTDSNWSAIPKKTAKPILLGSESIASTQTVKLVSFATVTICSGKVEGKGTPVAGVYMIKSTMVIVSTWEYIA